MKIDISLLEKYDCNILTDSGFEYVSNKVIKEEVCTEIHFDNWTIMKVANTHLFETKNRDWIYASELTEEDEIFTNDGTTKMVNRYDLGVQTVYDLTVETEKHQYYLDGVSSHNTGKTLISTLAGIKALKGSDIDKFVVTRPAVSVDEQHGFLPGTLQEKMAPWVMPIMDVFEDYYTPDQIEYMLGDNKIEIAPLAYMRGRSFKNAFIMADEMQNATESQMKMLLTRIGDNCKLVVTGDLAQHDRGFESNGLKDFIQRLESVQSDRIRIVRFDHSDIERHPAVAEVLSIYGEA